MTIKKALGILLLLAIVFFVGLWLVNAFLPNPYTEAVFIFITVTAPAYIMEKWEAFAIGAGAAIAGIGKVMSNANKKIDAAKAQVADAEQAKANAQNFAVDQTKQLDQLTKEKATLQQQVTEMQATRTEAEQLANQYQADNTALKREAQELKETITAKEQQIGYLQAKIDQKTVP